MTNYFTEPPKYYVNCYDVDNKWQFTFPVLHPDQAQISFFVKRRNAIGESKKVLNRVKTLTVFSLQGKKHTKVLELDVSVNTRDTQALSTTLPKILKQIIPAIPIDFSQK